MSDHISIRKDVPSGTIVIDRPACRNALTPRTIAELQTAFADFHGERNVRGVIITGAGDAFSSGTDLRHLHEQMQCPDPESFWQDEMPEMLALIETILRYPKPVVAAVDGVAAGAGVALMLAADFVVATRQSTFLLPEAKIGLVPGLAVPLLRRRCSLGFTNRMVFSGAAVDSDAALASALVDELVEPDLIWARANELVGEFASGAASSLQLARKLINDTISEEVFTQLSIGAANSAAARSTDSAREGVEAFVNRSDATPAAE